MQKTETIVRYPAVDLDERPHQGKGQTDYARLDAITEAELEASIDPEDEGGPGWSTAMPGFPGPHQRQLAVRFDRDVVAWFEAQGGDYQARMNAVLRDYVEARQRDEASQQG